MFVITFVLCVLATVAAEEGSAGYLFYSANVINLDLNETSYIVGCALNTTNAAGGVDSRQLTLTNLKGVAYAIKILNDSTIAHETNLRTSDESTICGSKEYVCRLNRTFIGMKTIYIGRPPPAIKPSDFKCISHNRKFLTCDFQRQNSCRLTTRYTLSMNRLGLITNCELSDSVSLLSFDSRSETCMFSAGHRNILFVVESTNVIGQTRTTFSVSHYDIVKPDAPRKLQIIDVTTSSIQIAWDLNVMIQNLDREIEYEFQIISKYGRSVRLKKLKFGKGVPMMYEFDNLYAYTSYELKIRVRIVPKSVRNFEEEYWSDWSSVNGRTNSCRPHQQPKTAPGAYSIKERRGSLCTVDVFWELVPEYLHNGNGFGYDIFAVTESGQIYKALQPIHPNGVATFRNMKVSEKYAVYLSSYNDEGKSDNVSVVFIHPPEWTQNPKIRRVLYNDSYHLEWFTADNSDKISNYTVMYCSFSATGSCQSSINIVSLPPNATTYSINSTKPLNFALAANYQFYSSEFSWMECVVPSPSNISHLSFKVTDVTEHSVTLRLFLSCTDRSLVERYEIRYWPKNDRSLEKNMTKPPYDTVISIDGLMIDSDYEIHVTAYDDNGVPHEVSNSVRTRDRDILVQFIMFLLCGLLVMAIMMTTATRRVKKMMNIKVDIPLGLLGIDEMPINDCHRSDQKHIKEEVEPKVMFSDLLDKDDLMTNNTPKIEKISRKSKSILKCSVTTTPGIVEHLQKPTVQLAIGNNYIQSSQMLSGKDMARQEILASGNRSSGSSGYVDVNLMMKQQIKR